MDKLKPCPFCGFEHIRYERDTTRVLPYRLECDNCGAATCVFKSQRSAENAWNTRPIEEKNILCHECGYWSIPDGWEEWTQPVDWSVHDCECFKHPDINHVFVDTIIKGNASVELEFITNGLFGCNQGKRR